MHSFATHAAKFYQSALCLYIHTYQPFIPARTLFWKRILDFDERTLLTQYISSLYLLNFGSCICFSAGDDGVAQAIAKDGFYA